MIRYFRRSYTISLIVLIALLVLSAVFVITANEGMAHNGQTAQTQQLQGLLVVAHRYLQASTTSASTSMSVAKTTTQQTTAQQVLASLPWLEQSEYTKALKSAKKIQ